MESSKHIVLSMVTNLSTPVSSKQTAQNVVSRIAAPFCRGMHRDNSWQAVSQLFRSIRALGGEVETQSANYFGECAGKRWLLEIEANGFRFPATLTASFSDAPNGEIYDLVLTF
jgi:hypothetical protein